MNESDNSATNSTIDQNDVDIMLGNDSESPARKKSIFSHEIRDERLHVRVSVPFQVEFPHGLRFSGVDLSLNGLGTQCSSAIQPGETISLLVLLHSADMEFVVPMTVKALRHIALIDGDDDVQICAFEIADIRPAHAELLRRVIRAYLKGRHLPVESMLGTEDPQTPRRRSTGNSIKINRPFPLKRYSIAASLFLLLLLVASTSIYRNFVLIEPSFAAVTAPRIDIRSPGSGIMGSHSLVAGDYVVRDSYLVRINNVNLEAELVMAQASERYNDRLIENLKDNLSMPGVTEVSMINSARPTSASAMNFEVGTRLLAEARMVQFETARDLEFSRVNALQTRVAKNEVFSPCDCTVAWALGSAGGTYIEEGDRIMTLIKTEAGDVMVEALVNMNDIGRIEPGQLAYIALDNSTRPIEARVRSVALDIERQPRAGFPAWVRQQQNVASVLLIPSTQLPADTVGQPVDVRFSDSPILARASEWVWQGARRVLELPGSIRDAIQTREIE